MSDKMKKAIRARMKRTGERYTTARMHLMGDAQPSPPATAGASMRAMPAWRRIEPEPPALNIRWNFGPEALKGAGHHRGWDIEVCLHELAIEVFAEWADHARPPTKEELALVAHGGFSPTTVFAGVAHHFAGAGLSVPTRLGPDPEETHWRRHRLFNLLPMLSSPERYQEIIEGLRVEAAALST